MTDALHVLVPVAPSEPDRLVEQTAKELSGLEPPPDCSISITFVLDQRDSSEELALEGVDRLHRETTDGRRAGAVEYALERIDSPEYVALFDVDVRPDKDFLACCLAELRRRPRVKLVTGRRYVYNHDVGFTPRVVASGYEFLNIQQRVAQFLRTYNHTNGCNGVLEYSALVKHGFRPNQLTPDVDFTKRLYLGGDRMYVTDTTRIGEQAPPDFRSFLDQQLRWMGGFVENLLSDPDRDRLREAAFRLSAGWYAQLLLPFLGVFLVPLAPLFTLFGESDSDNWPFLIVFLTVYCAAMWVMLLRIVVGYEKSWEPTTRTVKEQNS